MLLFKLPHKLNISITINSSSSSSNNNNNNQIQTMLLMIFSITSIEQEATMAIRINCRPIRIQRCWSIRHRNLRSMNIITTTIIHATNWCVRPIRMLQMVLSYRRVWLDNHLIRLVVRPSHLRNRWICLQLLIRTIADVQVAFLPRPVMVEQVTTTMMNIHHHAKTRYVVEFSHQSVTNLLFAFQSTSNASSGYESGLATNRQSSPVSSSVRTGSGSSIASDASSSSCHYNPGNGNHLPKLNLNSQEIDVDDRQIPVGGYVDDLMERIRKMPPKKRSKFYQMLDEERLKDVNNNHPKSQAKVPIDDEDDDTDSLTIDTSTNALLITEAVSDDEEDRTLSESLPSSRTLKTPAKKSMAGLNDSNYEELRAMGVPLTVLKALAYQQQQQQQQQPTDQQKNGRFNKCSVSSSQSSASENQRLLNARTILRHILQQQQQQQQQASHEKSNAEPMDYSSDDDGDVMEDEITPHRSSAASTPRHRNLIRSNSHNPLNVMLNPNDISSLSPPTSTSSSPDETDVQHQSSPTSISRPSSTPATLVSSACLF